MSTYREMTIEDTGYSPEDAVMIEHIMREEIFQSTLDWQTRSQFRRAALTAAKILVQDRSVCEEYFSKTRAIFEKMERASTTQRHSP